MLAVICACMRRMPVVIRCMHLWPETEAWCCPAPAQVFVESNDGVAGRELERELFILRKLIEKEKILRFAAAGAEPADFYICTFSNKTIVYKARARVPCAGLKEPI